LILDQVEDKKGVHTSLQDFQNQENGFTTTYYSQMHINNPIQFWKNYFNSEDHNELARFVVGIFKTIANSVASKRAFLAMDVIVIKLQSRLSANKADKLIYIVVGFSGHPCKITCYGL
jgi:hypothetical protein